MPSENVLAFWRQSFVMSAFLFSSLSGGMMLAFPGVLNSAILSPNSTDIQATEDESSWIAMSNGVAGMISFIILPPIMQQYGRRHVLMVLNSFMLAGWIIFVFARSIAALVAARMFQGLKIGGFIIGAITVSEYSSPKRRGYYHIGKLASVSIGVLICHGLSLCFTWRQTAAFAIIPSVLVMIIVYFWPESPPYLAMKGRFEECEKSFVWLNGNCSRDNKELVELIAAQKERLKGKKQKKLKIVKVLRKILDKDFKKAIFITIVLTMIQEASGRSYFVVYILQIMTITIGDTSFAVYCSMATDFITLIALFTSIFIVRYIRRRTLLFATGIFSVAILYFMSLLLFINAEFLSKFTFLLPSLILIYNFVINVGLLPIGFAIIGEVFSLRHRAVGSCLSGIIITFTYAVTLKITPMLIENTSLEGMYALFGVFMSIGLIILYFILPETKDRTLQDIEGDMGGLKVSVPECKSMMNNE